MPNTDSFQAHPDFFSSKEEGKQAVRVNTNVRYKFFRQTHFTAGDYEQFLEHWDQTSHVRTMTSPNEPCPSISCPLYRHLTTDDVLHSFEYIFHKFKKGIFVKIISNQVQVFLPFSKIDYTNEWADKIHVDPRKYPKGVFSMIEACTTRAGYAYDASKIHFMMDHWYANNGLLRYEYPISENDSGISTLRDMFMTLAAEKDLPDCEFFLNKRDFPILRTDGNEAYDCIFGSQQPLLSHKHDTYCPILGMTSTDEHADIPIPTWEDWARVCSEEGKLFGKEFVKYPDPYIADFHSKKPLVVFRGASTGMGVTYTTNPRLFYSHLSLQWKTKHPGMLDCGITKWNIRPRRDVDTPYYDTLDQEILNTLPLVNFLTPQEQATYKYILHLPGHSEAYRLSLELGYGSVIFLYPCKYKLWFVHLLKPYVHYIPLDPLDPEQDLLKKMEWCRAHEDECEIIASNARTFYLQYLSRTAILDHLQQVLIGISHQAGKLVFPSKSLLDFQLYQETHFLDIEAKVLKNIVSLSPIENSSSSSTPLHPRSFQVLLFKMDPEKILSLIEEAPILKQSRNIILRKITIQGRALCVKTPLHPNESVFTHESFIGQMGLNRIANTCPMIVYTYGRWGNHVLSDFIEGETLEKTLHDLPSDRVVSFFLSILQQLSVLLQYLQSEFGFLHFDLYPWNIMIRQQSSPITVHVPIDSSRTAKFTTCIFPVLIDFGKSHIVYQSMHFVNVSPFQLHLHQDILSILISGLFILTQHHKLSSTDISRVLKLLNYIGGTSYTRYRYFDTMGQAKAFLKWKKKFSNMLVDGKEEFRLLQPIRFYEYMIISRFQALPISISNSYSGISLSCEIYYCRQFILYELSNLLDSTTTTTTTTASSIAEKPSNSIHTLFKLYMEYKIRQAMGMKDMHVALEKMKAWISHVHISSSLKNSIVPLQENIIFPRFLSHPNIKHIRSLHSQKISNHFFEKHKILHILLYASKELSFLHSLHPFLLHEQNTYFLQSILGENRHVSISNHLYRYLEWLEQ